MTNMLSSKFASTATATISPKRPLQKKQNKLGPYNLLQTLGEGEFGKVKLGIHIETGQQVAIKLIKKEGAGSDGRINKVEREISVLKTLNHPYIVKLYNVVETEKYIGIILEYASGGELFEYILAHRYLKEKDAKRFFAQLMSSVQYMHKRKIVHRDLKLENILLDKNRNIIVTDFGFANQFSSAADDLMATTCGSPCYAAPELVVNAGLYAGSAVDIWSCGVILYAMLCGFLPFDDDPANPDSDNINQLYRYILSTNLVFPTHVSSNARDLLDKMLVPDPAKRCSLDFVIKHPWLESHRTFLKKDTAQIEKEESVAQRLSVKPGIKNKSNLIINSSVSTSQPRKVTAPGVSTARKTHIPVVSRDRFAPISNEKYLETNSKLSNTITEKPVIADSSTKTGPFRRFSIGRSSAITNTSEKQIHATNVAPTTIDRSPDITRKPVKQEEEGHYTSNHSSIAVASHLTAANTDDNVQNIYPEKSLSSPTSTSDTKRSGISTLGSIRRGQRLGTDKFLSFFTNGRSSHTPTVTKKQEDMPSIFDEGKHKNDALYVHTEVNNNVHEATEQAAQDSAISCSNDTTETEERLPVNHNKHHHAILHSSSEASTIGGSTPSLCPSSPLNSVADPLTPLSPTFSLGQHHQPNFKAETNGASIRSIVNTQEESSRQPNSNQNFHSTSSVIHEDEESEVYEPSFSQEQCSQARDRGNSISTTSVLSEHQGSMNSNSVSFKEAPRHASPLITRQRNSHKHHQTDKDSSIRSASIDEDRDNSSVSSHGAYPLQLEVSNSTRLMTKAVENGGRHVIAAVRRSIYRKHKSQPPPQHHTEENNHVTTTSTTTKEPITSFAKSRFEETDAAPKSSHRDRSTWSASTRTTSGGVQLPTNKKKVDSSTTTNNQSLAPKRTGNKMMDWIKKKSHAKEMKKETNATITPKTTTSKLNPSDQILTRSRKMNSIKKKASPAVTAAEEVAAGSIEKAAAKTLAPTAASSSPKTKVLATSKNRKNVIPTQTHASKKDHIIANQNTATNTMEQTAKSSATAVAPTFPVVEVPERSNTNRNKRAISGSENAFADLAKKDSEDDCIQVHQGAVDRTALTSQSPALVIKDLMRILRILGIDAHLESPFVLKCCRRKARSFIAAQRLRKKQIEDEYDEDDEDEEDEDEPIDGLSATSSGISNSAMQITLEKGLEPIYGDASIDNGDEIRFAVEICRFKNLPGLYIVDIRRLRGNAWAYRLLYHKLIDFLDLEKNSYLKSF